MEILLPALIAIAIDHNRMTRPRIRKDGQKHGAAAVQTCKDRRTDRVRREGSAVRPQIADCTRIAEVVAQRLERERPEGKGAHRREPRPQGDGAVVHETPNGLARSLRCPPRRDVWHQVPRKRAAPRLQRHLLGPLPAEKSLRHHVRREFPIAQDLRQGRRRAAGLVPFQVVVVAGLADIAVPRVEGLIPARRQQRADADVRDRLQPDVGPRPRHPREGQQKNAFRVRLHVHVPFVMS